MKKPSNKLTEKQLTIISMVAGAVLFLAVCGIIFWAVSTADSLSAEVRKLDTAKNDLAQKERNLPRLEKEIESLQVEVERSVQVLPNEQEIAELIRNMGNIVSQTEQDGIAIKIRTFEPEQEKALPGLKPDESKTDQRFTPHPYLVEAEGSYYHLGKFINLLENHIRFIKIQTYEMSDWKDDKLADKPEKQLKMKIITYTYNPSKGEKAVARERLPIDVSDLTEKKFIFESRNRRDPFQIPLIAVDGGTKSRPVLPPAEQQKRVTDMERLSTELNRYLQVQPQQVDKAVKAFTEIEKIHSETFTIPELYQRVQQLYGDAKAQISGIKGVIAIQALARATDILDEMNKEFESGDYGAIARLKDQMQVFSSVQIDDPDLLAKVNKCREQADELVRRSTIRLEFAKAGVKVTGISSLPRRRTVIFNGNVYGEEGMDSEIRDVKFFVKSINSDTGTVRIVYKGEEIELSLGAEISEPPPPASPSGEPESRETPPAPPSRETTPAPPAKESAPADAGSDAPVETDAPMEEAAPPETEDENG